MREKKVGNKNFNFGSRYIYIQHPIQYIDIILHIYRNNIHHRKKKKTKMTTNENRN